jgi:hypothetical protein
VHLAISCIERHSAWSAQPRGEEEWRDDGLLSGGYPTLSLH